MKIGILAGTFDPIHQGHLGFAKQAIDEAKLDKVIIIAEKEPYRKKPHAAWDHRQAMIERATEQMPGVDHNYEFAAELSHQHTMENMLHVAKKHYGEENEIWFLVGSDIFEHMHRWQETLSHEHYGGFVVALRDDHTATWVHEMTEKLKNNFPKLNLIVLTNENRHVSSSKVRESIKLGIVNEAITKKVESYINSHQLYKK